MNNNFLVQFPFGLERPAFMMPYNSIESENWILEKLSLRLTIFHLMMKLKLKIEYNGEKLGLTIKKSDEMILELQFMLDGMDNKSE
jgi:hypothetical protein